jgi:hypothetical protein
MTHGPVVFDTFLLNCSVQKADIYRQKPIKVIPLNIWWFLENFHCRSRNPSASPVSANRKTGLNVRNDPAAMIGRDCISWNVCDVTDSSRIRSEQMMDGSVTINMFLNTSGRINNYYCSLTNSHLMRVCIVVVCGFRMCMHCIQLAMHVDGLKFIGELLKILVTDGSCSGYRLLFLLAHRRWPKARWFLTHFS